MGHAEVGFVQRLGRSSIDQFYSGTYTSDGVRIGYICIPSFVPLSSSFAVNQFATEVAYMQANTDGLVVDVMQPRRLALITPTVCCAD